MINERLTTEEIGRLPAWAVFRDNEDAAKVRVVVDATVAYPLFALSLSRFGLMRAQGDSVPMLDQYWLEVIRRFVTFELQKIIGHGFNLRIEGKEFALSNFPAGKGDAAGAAEAPRLWREFERVRG